jgi:hypothetical protein
MLIFAVCVINLRFCKSKEETKPQGRVLTLPYRERIDKLSRSGDFSLCGYDDTDKQTKKLRRFVHEIYL